MTVLSCFWLFNNLLLYRKIIDKYWPNSINYHLLVENLRINPEMAKKSYVTDFARISNEKGKRDTKKCKELLLMEIQILNPKLVILVGAEPRDAFINEIQRYPDKFMSVPFSLIGVPKKQKKKGH